MSLYSALLSGASGITAQASAIAAISDNISNVNTTGFKRLRNDFSALVSTQSARTTYNAAGVSVAQRSLISAQGPIVAATQGDLAIQGNGFFVVSAGRDDNTTNQTFVTRAGDFAPDEEGFLRNSSGFYLRGIPLAPDGTGGTVANGDITQLEPLNVVNITGAAQPTENITLNGNISAGILPSAAAAAYAPGQLANPASGVTADFARDFQYFDSLGQARTLTVSFLRSPTPNQYFVEIFDPASPPAIAGPNGLVTSGTLIFDGNGVTDLTATTPALLAPLSLNFNPAVSAATTPQIINLDLDSSDGQGGFTQFGGDSTLESVAADGRPFGALQSVSVDEEGFVSALFTNGQTERVARIPLATFVNPDGLNARPGSVFQISVDSGAPTLAFATEGGAGSIQAGALENSNVDLGTEFTNLIVSQRAYSAATRVINAADELLTELIQVAG